MYQDKDEVLARYEPVIASHEGAERIVAVRRALRECAAVLCDVLPEGRGKAVALTKLEEAGMWAVKAVTHG